MLLLGIALPALARPFFLGGGTQRPGIAREPPRRRSHQKQEAYLARTSRPSCVACGRNSLDRRNGKTESERPL